MKKCIALVLVLTLLLGCFAASAHAAAFSAGTYTVTVKGHNGPLTAEVTFSEAAITEVKITEHAETPGVADPALEQIPAAVVEYQSTAVDTIAGATVTSKAILAAVEEAAKQAGANPEELRVAVEKVVQDLGDRTENAEVLVIGGGGTGLAAAMSAIKNGAKDVILVEKMPRFGGSTSVSGAVISAENTRYYKEAGLVTNHEAWLEEWKASSIADIGVLGRDPGYPTYDRVSAYFTQVAEAVDWLEEEGVAHWVEYPFFPGGRYQVPDYIITDGMADPEGGYMLINEMVKWLETNGADLRLNTAGTKLITDDKGAVIGAVVEDANGSYPIYAERGVVLATGGFAASHEMMETYLPQFADWIDLTSSGLGDTGDGMQMAVEVGGVMYDDPYVITLGSTSRNPALSQFCMSVNLWGRVVVNSQGARFFNEYSMPYQATVALSETEDGVAWALGDSKNPLAAALDEAVDGVEVVKGDTLEELAEKMGVDKDVLIENIKTYNDTIATNDDPLGKPAEYKEALDAAPYYGVRIYVCTGGTIGGVKTNPEFQVLREDGSVIEGLYAGGETSNREMYAYAYSSGSGVGYALASGREIGINIMK